MSKKTKTTLFLQISIVVLATIGITYAVLTTLGTVSVGNLTVAPLDVTYTGTSTLTINSLTPILSSDIATKAQKFDFTVKAKATNTVTGIYEVVLRDLVISTNLKGSTYGQYVKWRLYKSDSLINSGTFASITSDQAIASNPLRLVISPSRLTLPASSGTADSYSLWIWIEDSCSDYDVCSNASAYNQNAMMNQTITGELGVDLYKS
ncbi:MAG: hypothetical protein Q4G04_01190 [bacterium]|nr:hypothetical protein [bacterium]